MLAYDLGAFTVYTSLKSHGTLQELRVQKQVQQPKILKIVMHTHVPVPIDPLSSPTWTPGQSTHQNTITLNHFNEPSIIANICTSLEIIHSFLTAFIMYTD